VQFRYKLEGYDDEWQEAGTRRAAYYTRVPPGSYRFRVTAATGDTDHDAPEAALALIVLPHFRQTWWFRTLLLATGATALLCIYRLRVRHIREVERLRWRIASDLHDEVGSNLSNIALLSQLAESASSTPPAQRTEFIEISRVAVATANAVRDLVWFINPECDTLEELVQQMDAVAGRTVPSVAVEFDAKIEAGSRRLSLPFRRHIFFFFKEALHNALKHSKASWIQIRLQERAGVLELEVSDNGTGYNPASVKQGQGLKTMRRRADDLNGVLKIESQTGAGTQIRLQARLS
jgi:signal transduction histidine kinase